MVDLLYPTCAAVAWLVLVFSFLGSRSLRDLSILPVRVGMACLAVAFTMSTPSVWVRIDAIAGWPNLAALVAHMSVLGYVACVQILLLSWTHGPSRARSKVGRRLIGLALVTVALVGLFLAAPDSAERAHGFVISVVGEPTMATYLLLYLTAFAVTQAEALILGVRYARVCASPWLRRGLRSIAGGGVLGLLYCLVRYSDLVLAQVNPVAMSVIEPFAALGAGLGEIVNLVGWTVPLWGSLLSKAQTWTYEYRNYRRLDPLWRALTQAYPEVRLDPVPARLVDILTLRDLSFRLQRRVIEIRDAQLALSPRRDPRIAAEAEADADAAGFAPIERAAYVEARILHAALQAEPSTALSSVVAYTPDVSGPPQDPRAETDWLVTLADMFRTHIKPRTPLSTLPRSLGNRT